MPDVEHRQHKGLNNRAENSHQPTRRRERIMKRFKSRRQVQRFLSTHDQVANLFHIPYSEHTTANARRALRERAFGMWSDISRVTSQHDKHSEICQAFLQLRGVKLTVPASAVSTKPPRVQLTPSSAIERAENAVTRRQC